jgi:vancomycin permeability regulator SanA
MKNTTRTILLVILIGIFLIFLLPIIVRILIVLYARPLLSSIEDTPSADIAIVFGAGLRRDNLPSPILQDRVSTAVELYKSGKVKKLLMTGHYRGLEYNEPIAMASYAVVQGVPVEKIIMDFSGNSTYDSCYRAKEHFKIQSALLVTQKFHLPRAIFICNQLGLNAKGVSADQRKYRLSSLTFWEIREIAASMAAVWDIWIVKRLPTANAENHFSQGKFNNY